MIARTPEQPHSLSSESSADSRLAVVAPGEVAPGENVGNGEQLPESGAKPSWGIMTLVPASLDARRRRAEKRRDGVSKPAVMRRETVMTAHERLALAAWHALARQIAARVRASPFHQQAIGGYWRHAIRCYGRLHCARCRQDEVVPFVMQGLPPLPAVQPVPRRGHDVVADRSHVRAARAMSAQLAGRVRLMGARLGVAAGGGRFGLLHMMGNAPGQAAPVDPRGGASAPAGLGSCTSTIHASCGRVGCPRTMCVRVVLGSGDPET